MRVLHVLDFYPEFGGPFSFAMDLMREMSKQGVRIYVISPLPQNYRTEDLDFVKNLSFEVQYIRQSLVSHIWPSFSIGFFKRIPSIAKQVDLIHLHGLFNMYSIPTFLTKKNFVLSLHGIFMKEAYNSSLKKKLKKELFMILLGKKILNKSAKICVTTQQERSHFETFFPNLLHKTVIIPNGIDLNSYIPRINKRSKIGYIKKVLFLGRINWIKGLDVLINGFSRILKERRDLELIIAGKDSGNGYEDRIRRLIKYHGIENFVRFAGFVQGEKKISLLSEADLFVLPSYSENFAVSVIEAMASRVPVIVSNRVGISPDIKERRAGIIIEPTEEGVYRGIKQWLSMSIESVEEMKNRAFKAVSELYDIRVIANMMIKLYQELVKNVD